MSATLDRVISCGARAQWLDARRSFVTASDAAAILGCSPWGSALSVYAEKVGAAEPAADTALFRRGRRMQELVLQEFREATGRAAHAEPEYTIRLHPDHPWLGASLDATVDGEAGGPDVPLELKTGGDWDEWDGDRAPVQYEVQLQIQMAVTGSSRGTLACLRSLRDEAPLVRDRERDDEFLGTALPVLERFIRHVERREPPSVEGWPGELKAARKLWRGPDADGTVLLTDSELRLVDKLEGAKACEREDRAAAERIEAQLWLVLGAHQFGALPDGTFLRGRVFKDGKRVLDRWRPRIRRG